MARLTRDFNEIVYASLDYSRAEIAADFGLRRGSRGSSLRRAANRKMR